MDNMQSGELIMGFIHINVDLMESIMLGFNLLKIDTH